MSLNPYPSSSSSSSISTPASITRPQQYGLSTSNTRQPPIIRQTPPSAIVETPSHHKRSRYHTPHHPQNVHRPMFDSPFISPPPTYRIPHAAAIHREPLVLDPTKQSTPLNGTTPQSSSHSRSSKQPVMHKLLQAATRGIRETTAVVTPGMATSPYPSNPQIYNSSNSSVPSLPQQHSRQQRGATVLARSSAQAGFLHKAGVNIPEFKRRFFVLKPVTHLYYFLSPHDIEPRGHVDLEGSNVEVVEETPDGRYRFAITWAEREFQTRTRMLLEARTKEVGEEWMKSLQTERVSVLKDQLTESISESQAKSNRIKELEREVQDYKMVEKDRDGALEDARRWKAQFERLDEALRLLTQQVRRPPSSSPTKTEAENVANVKEDEKKEVSERSDRLDDNAEENTSVPQPDEDNTQKPASSALLDITIDEDKDIADIFEVPGRHFSALSNACHQQRESLRLTSVEATTAVEDLQAANGKLQAMETRMEKAEKHLCKLWEENCSIRKTLKQKKREKRVLVREVKALQQQLKDEEFNKLNRPQPQKPIPSYPSAEGPPEESTLIGSDEERLILELEELEQNVASSIRLHERYLVVTGRGDCEKKNSQRNAMADVAKANCDTSRTSNVARSSSLRLENTTSSGANSPIQPKTLSLFDNDDHSESGSEENSIQSTAVSSVGAEMGDPIEYSDSIQSTDRPASIHSTDSSPERLNPLLRLDEDLDEDDCDKQATLCAASTQSSSSKSMITDNGHATSRLVCPLADVVETNEASSALQKANEECEVYHLTFYTQKIGIQFQKAPPAPKRSRGLLTDAMTADLKDKKNGSSKTAAELRRIASISTWAKAGQDIEGEEVCQVATPIDIVLVCGFEGFDDTGTNARPKLGARLVAFDGVSVEVGHWTFTSIRRAIKARGRPLTLSFRNDFLTTEQRTVLTKAVTDVEGSRPPPRRTTQQCTEERPPSTTPSVNSALSHETDCFVNETDGQTIHSQQDDDFSASASSSNRGNFRKLSTSNSVSTHQSNFRSFSEAGSSSVVSTTFAPLMANLMKGIGEREKFTPEYLSREPESLDETSQHQDFKSNLL